MVGTGIFLTSGGIVREVASPALALLVWLAAGLLSLCGALTYAELGALFPRAGGIYHYLRRASHFFYGFTDSELRRSGRMTARQKRRRAELERRWGRPDPRSTEKQVAALLGALAPQPGSLTLHTDEHADYPRALARLPHLEVVHHTISSRAARTSRNPLFEINLLDGLLRHSGANHKRETWAFSKRRQSAIERLALFLVWRNYVKSFSERKRDATPAMRLGILECSLTLRRVLEHRLFPSRIPLPECWRPYYWRRVATRALPRGVGFDRRFAA